MVASTRRGARGRGGGGGGGRSGTGIGVRSSRGRDRGVAAQREAVAEPSEYERQREERVRENRARLEALGIRNLAFALRSGEEQEVDGEGDSDRDRKRAPGRAGGKGKGRGDGGDEDEDYRPENDGSSSSSDREPSDEDEEEGRQGGGPSPGHRTPRKKVVTPRKRGKSSTTRSKGITPIKESFFRAVEVPDPHDFADEEAALQQAISLSLGEANPVNIAAGKDSPAVAKSGRVPAQMPGKWKRRKQDGPPRMQLTEDEAVAYFFTLDQAGKGYLTVRDLQKMASAHDFCWRDEEIADMIYLFDSDGDAKLSITDFHKILTRCNMVENSNTS